MIGEGEGKALTRRIGKEARKPAKQKYYRSQGGWMAA